jgi:hypothetical protein
VTLSALLLTVLTGWLLAAPPGASPDDAYHMTSIWCAEGFKDGICLEDPGAPDLARVLVPRSVPGVTCFQYDGSQSAACALESLTPGLQQFVPVSGSNIRGERPTLYYRAMHLFVGEDVGRTAALIRTANLLVVAAMVIATALIAERRLRSAFLLSSLVASVPLGLFLVTSVNTSAWGIAGLATLWANGVTAISHDRARNRLVAVVLVVIGLALGLGSRTEAIGHIAIIATLVAVLWWTTYSTRRHQGRAQGRADEGNPSSLRSRLRGGVALLSILVVVSLIALAAPDSAGLRRIIGELRRGYDRLSARGIGDPFLAISFEVPSLWTGALGHIWGLGALDTPIPTLATLPLIGAYFALLTLGLQASSRARVLSASIVAIGLYSFPTFSLMRSGLIVYEELQPRQFMVMLFVLLGIGLLRLQGEAPLMISRGTRAIIAAALGLGHAIALLVTMRRHISGLVEFRYVSFSSEIEWWWASAPAPNLVWAVASIAYIVAAVIVLGLFSRGGDEAAWPMTRRPARS